MRVLSLFATVAFIIALLPVVTAQKSNEHFATLNDVIRDSSQKNIQSKNCNAYVGYEPDTTHPEYTPIRMVRINIHVMQDSKGQNNFPDNKQGRQWIKDLVANANMRLSSNQKMNLPQGNNTPVLPIPFRYVLTGRPGHPSDDGIYFHRDDTLSFLNKKARGSKNTAFDTRQYNTYGIQKDTVINIFMIEHNPDSLKSKTYRPSNDGIGMGPWAKIVGCYNIWKSPVVRAPGDTSRYSPWDASALFNHELGHCLGLQHTWNMDDGCDDTPKNPDCWNFNEPPGCTAVSNNVMDYNNWKSAYSPCQIGKIVMGFYNDKGTRKYLAPDWCTFNEAKSDTIQRGQTIEWNASIDVLGNLVVEPKATLIIHCTTSIPPGGRVILSSKSTLILDGCVLTSRCTSPFDGIVINGKGKKAPKIYLKNGAAVENVKHPI